MGAIGRHATFTHIGAAKLKIASVCAARVFFGYVCEVQTYFIMPSVNDANPGTLG